MMTPHATFFAVDVETTGLNSNFAEIVSLSCTLLDNQINVLDTLTIYAQPENGCPTEASRINGYTPELWATKGAVTQKELLAKVRGFVNGQSRLYPIGHNINFDIGFIRTLYQRFNADKDYGRTFSYHHIDTLATCLLLDIAQTGQPQGGYKLTNLCDRFGISLGEKAHDAEADITATVELLKHCLTHIRGSLPAPEPVVSTYVKDTSFLIKTGEDWTIRNGRHTGRLLSDVKDVGFYHWILRNVTDLKPDAKAAVLLLAGVEP